MTSDIVTALSLIAGFITICGFMWKLHKDINATLEKSQKNIDVVFRRFDEHKGVIEIKLENMKREHDAKYVKKEVCGIMHTETEKNHLRIEKKIDDLVKEFSSKIELVNQNILILIKGKND